MDNPFASPQAVSTPEGPIELSPERERHAQLGELFVAWERLRLWYNGVLGCVTLLAVLVIHPGMLLDLNILEAMVFAAIGANACFCAGPFVEGYITWWIGPVRWMRMTLFIVETLGSIVLTLLVILALDFGLLLPA